MKHRFSVNGAVTKAENIVGGCMGKEYTRFRLYAPEFSTEYREAGK